jgi:hypothetical protein
LALHFTGKATKRFFYKFPWEQPTAKDWAIWGRFWLDYTGQGYKPAVPLGNGCTQHTNNGSVFTNSHNQVLTRIMAAGTYVYRPSRRLQSSRSVTMFTLAAVLESISTSARGVPTLVIEIAENTVQKLQDEPALAVDKDAAHDFWELLYSWGGKWMRSNILKDQPTYSNLEWLMTGLNSGMLIWATDGSYKRKRAQDLCGVGWMILCTQTRLRLTGTFWECNPFASSYRAEMLGLCALHILVQAIRDYHQFHHWSAILFYDNKKTLDVSNHHHQWIKPSAKCADIQQSFPAIKMDTAGNFTHMHVYGHMDKYLPWGRLTLIQQMNCVCDTLTKAAFTNAIINGYLQQPMQFLPKEDTALVVWGDKMTGDISHKI